MYHVNANLNTHKISAETRENHFLPCGPIFMANKQIPNSDAHNNSSRQVALMDLQLMKSTDLLQLV